MYPQRCPVTCELLSQCVATRTLLSVTKSSIIPGSRRIYVDQDFRTAQVWILFGLETLSFAFALYEMLEGASLHCLSCIPLGIWSNWFGSFEAISILTVSASLLQFIFLSFGSMIWMIANFVCDLIITIETTRLLFLRGTASSFKDTRGLVMKLIRLTLETGAVTTIAMLLQFVLSRVDAMSTGYSVLQLSVYANCLLATLNARLVISKDSTHVQQASTVLFDAPTSTIVPNHPPANCDDVIIVQSRLDMRCFEEAGDDAESVYVEGAEKPSQRGLSQV
ncbi:hypothetical protein BU15DRAFT_60017 [Melanogaster broomeanus]|nr:hypothetical protein BU15DRAFT_60017 [Melanogaster broomeanus]